MKRLLLTTGIIVLIAAIVGATDVRIKDTVGIESLIVLNTTTETDTSAMIGLGRVGDGDARPYSGVMGWIYAPTPTAYVDTSLADSAGLSDSVIVTVCIQFGYIVDTIKVDTLLSPDTMAFEWWADYEHVQTGTNTYIPSDSSSDSAWSGAIWLPTDNPTISYLMYDNLFFIATAYDSTTGGDSALWALAYRVRLIEK